MDTVRVVKEFLEDQGAVFAESDGIIRFQYSFHVHNGDCNGWVEIMSRGRFEVAFTITPIGPQAQEFVMALPEFDRTLFFVENTEQPNTVLLTWKSGRQYAGTLPAVRKVLPQIFEDADLGIDAVMSLFNADVAFQHPLLPRDLVGLMNNWAGRA